MGLITFSILSLIAGFVSVAVILAAQLHFKRQRSFRFDSLELVPNILMTRFPLMFVGRPRSLFRVSGDFFEMPLFLKEHGFQVEEIEMVDGRANLASLLRILATTQGPVHLFVTDAFAAAAYDLALEGHVKIATLTLLGKNPRGRNRSSSPSDLRPTRLPVFEKPELRPSMVAETFATEEFALGHMVSLAEYDLR